jgi:sedoheptulokinase
LQGYGCATYLWLLKNQRKYLAEEQFDCAGTLMDFVVAAVCDLEKPVTSDQLAASFGYFNIHTCSWNTEM